MDAFPSSVTLRLALPLAASFRPVQQQEPQHVAWVAWLAGLDGWLSGWGRLKEGKNERGRRRRNNWILSNSELVLGGSISE
ncbi:hypothetical protein E2C01_041717 [Portunus trituberculatus]|uniref:Uncharacterized protein n=1 Tax=Portunus trituberculatus TaxID=210409 RepID=A0A5B7FR42_PORTR|nr:hypothetical protein [Portunus trituberculatus]